MVGVSLLIQGKTKDFILGKLLLTGVKSVSAHCHEKWHANSSLFKVMCKCALFEKSNYDLFLLLYLFFIFLVLVLFFIAIGFYLLFKGSIFRSTAFL